MSKAKEIAEYLDGRCWGMDWRAANELRRLSELNEKMLVVLEKASVWHRGDKWRDSDYPAECLAWEVQMQNLDNVIKEAKEQQ
jgi:hypothetical protein